MGHRILYIPKPTGSDTYYPKYGLLYNWYAANDARNIVPTGWHLSTDADFVTLGTYLGGNSIAGGKMRENNASYWNNTSGASNTALFNGRGNGYRNYLGTFSSINFEGGMWTPDDPFGSSVTRKYYLRTNSTILDSGNGDVLDKKTGYAVRPVKDSTTLTDGQTGTMTGNDGKVYRTICIGTQEWLADNYAETRFRDGSIIPWYGADSANYFTNAEWGSLTTAGCCAYNNTLSNVGPGFTFPT